MTTKKDYNIKITSEKFENKANNIEILHNEKLRGQEGTFQIDILVTFYLLGVEYKTIVECKRHINPIKRKLVQVLNDKRNVLGAQKGILVSTSGF